MNQTGWVSQYYKFNFTCLQLLIKPLSSISLCVFVVKNITDYEHVVIKAIEILASQGTPPYQNRQTSLGLTVQQAYVE